MSNTNRPVPGADQYYPINEPPIGTVLPQVCLVIGSGTSLMLQVADIGFCGYRLRILKMPLFPSYLNPSR